ncbi:hypothetical protein Tco_0613462 [Tanacetum coccineum]
MVWCSVEVWRVKTTDDDDDEIRFMCIPPMAFFQQFGGNGCSDGGTNRSIKSVGNPILSLHNGYQEKLVPLYCVIFDFEPLSSSFDFVFTSDIFKSLSFCLGHLCRLAILCLDQHAHTLHHIESLLIISLDRLDILKEDLEYRSLLKSLSLLYKSVYEELS